MLITRAERRHVARIAGRHALHRRTAAPPAWQSAHALPDGPFSAQRSSAPSARTHRRIVRRVEIVAEADRPRRVAGLRSGFFSGGSGPFWVVEECDDVRDVLGRQHAGRSPRRHEAARERRGAGRRSGRTSYWSGSFAVPVGRQIGAHVARRPHVFALDQVAARARPADSVEEQAAALLRISRDGGQWRLAERRHRPRVVVSVGAKAAEVLRRPAAVAHGPSRPSGGRHVTSGLGDRARDPRGGRQPAGGRAGGRSGSAAAQPAVTSAAATIHARAKSQQDAQKGPDARRRPTAAREA